MAKILAFSGSTRKGSYNTQLLKIAAQGAEEAGAVVTVVDLADYPMPLIHEDLEKEKGMPAAAKQFKQLMVEHDALLIASPEYNSAFTPLLKNTLDWVSRAESKDEPPLKAYRNKVAAILSASPGALGGGRGLVFLRLVLSNIGVLVLPEQQVLPRAFEAFNPDGTLIDDKKQKAVMELGARLAEATKKIVTDTH